MISPATYWDGDQCKQNHRTLSHWILDAERLKIFQALHCSINHIHNREHNKKTEEPRSTIVKILFEVFLALGLVGKENCSDKEMERCIENQEGVGAKGPMCNTRKRKFKPPKMDRYQQQVKCPADMNGVDSFPPGVLHKPCKAIKHSRNCKPCHNANYDPDMSKRCGVWDYRFQHNVIPVRAHQNDGRAVNLAAPQSALLNVAAFSKVHGHITVNIVTVVELF